jgi:hypothetical protein
LRDLGSSTENFAFSGGEVGYFFEVRFGKNFPTEIHSLSSAAQLSCSRRRERASALIDDRCPLVSRLRELRRWRRILRRFARSSPAPEISSMTSQPLSVCVETQGRGTESGGIFCLSPGSFFPLTICKISRNSPTGFLGRPVQSLQADQITRLSA